MCNTNTRRLVLSILSEKPTLAVDFHSYQLLELKAMLEEGLVEYADGVYSKKIFDMVEANDVYSKILDMIEERRSVAYEI